MTGDYVSYVVNEVLVAGASCSIEIDKGDPIGSTSFRAAATGTGETTLRGGLMCSSNIGDELRALPDHVLGATRVLLLEILDSTLLDLLLEPILVISLSFPKVLLMGGVFLTAVVESGFLGGTSVVEVILVKGHVFPSIVQ
ncbi:hypothetical protein Tco_1138112, partial [Tanacetum coccineum]